MLTRENAEHRIDYSIIDFPADARGRDSVLAATSAWLDSAEMTKLLGHFGHKLTAHDLGSRLTEAETLTRDIFDFRRGGERWEARQADFPAHVTETTDALVKRLYREPTGNPAADFGPYDHALVLGGRINSCLLRGELLAELVSIGLDVSHIWGLGSRRAITPGEQELATDLGASWAQDELDVMAVALSATFDSPQMVAAPRTPGPSEVRTLRTDPIPVIGLAAAPAPGSPRATTSDTYRHFVNVAHTSPGSRILVVTSAIHGPFQHAQALAMLGAAAEVSVTTVGAHIGTSSRSDVRTTWTTAEWLQEIRSTIWSMRMMYDALHSSSAS